MTSIDLNCEFITLFFLNGLLHRKLHKTKSSVIFPI